MNRALFASKWSHVVSARSYLRFVMPAAFVGAFFVTLSSAWAITPHSGFSTATELCGACHIPHSAAAGTKIMRSEETVLCLSCHDGRGSTLNISSDFNSGSDSRYSHDVSTAARGSSGGSTACDGCHNPHDAVAGGRYVDPDARGAAMSAPIESVIAADGSVWVLVGSEHDAVSPVVSAESISALPEAAASPVVAWTTNEGATSWIDWGTTASYELGNATSGAPFGSAVYSGSHSVTMTGLTVGVMYHYRIRTADALGNLSLGADRVYKPTTPPPAPVISDVTTVTGSGWGPEPVPVSSSTVVSSDGHAVEYQFEVVGGAMSGWLAAPAWTAELCNGWYTVRVRARDAVDTAAVSAWSAPDPGGFEVLNAEVPYWAPVTSDSQIEAALWDFDVSFTAPASAETLTPAAEETVTPTMDSYSVDTDLLVVRHRDSAGVISTMTVAAAWESSTVGETPPVPAAPGSSVGIGTHFKAASANGNYWRTALASGDRAWDWQLVRVDLGSSAQTSTAELSLLWRGHGVPTATYNTALYVWDVDSAAWRTIVRENVPVDRTVGWTTQSVANEFCLSCHDGDAPDGSVMPSGVTTISAAWGVAGDKHGAGVGAAFGGPLVAPYSRGQGSVACMSCHDTHGSGSIYHFPSNVNATPVAPIANGSAGALCAGCHSGGLTSWHGPCYDCHSEPHELAPDITDRLPTLGSDCFSCHGHGKSWTHVDGCLACHGVGELQALGAGGHAPWTYTHTF